MIGFFGPGSFGIGGRLGPATIRVISGVSGKELSHDSIRRTNRI
jgi:hypothetical protein